MILGENQRKEQQMASFFILFDIHLFPLQVIYFLQFSKESPKLHNIHNFWGGNEFLRGGNFFEKNIHP